MTRLVLVRHGESNSTVARVIGGHRTCTGLSSLGRVQADALAARLRRTGEVPATALIASHYPRAVETAEILAPALGLPVTIDDGIGEHDPGPDLDGMSFERYVELYGRPDWEGDPHATIFPGGETMADFQHRVSGALHRILGVPAGAAEAGVDEAGVDDAAAAEAGGGEAGGGEDGVAEDGGAEDGVAEDGAGPAPDATIVLVCHGGVIDTAFRHLLRLPMAGGFELWTSNTSLTELRRVRAGRWLLRRYNDAAHLEGLDTETSRR